MTQTQLSLGKWRGLHQCSTTRNALVTLAIDQRNNLRQSLRPDAPDAVTPAEMVAFKTEVVSVLSPVAPSVLLDPEVGAAQCVASGALSGQNGLMIAVEATGYAGNATERESRLLPNWGVAKARRMGASAIKLLVYYHPEAPNARDMETFVKQVADDCLAHDIAFFLEPLSYSPDASKKNLTSDEKRQVVIASARNLVVPGVDVVKAEFPLDAKEQPDERIWAEACAELSAACAVPWVLLSAGVNYETYLRQVVIACQAGASGVAVGRAVWKEATALSGEARTQFLHTTARSRMSRITQLCDALAKPWTEFYAPEPVDEKWYAK
jgi:tagatose 1,6-diphosphate aldolase